MSPLVSEIDSTFKNTLEPGVGLVRESPVLVDSVSSSFCMWTCT